MRRPSVDTGDPEAIAALDEDVHPPVVEDVRDLLHLGERADVAAAGVVLEHEAERLGVGDALADQLLVPRLEDVERHALRRREHQASGNRPISGTPEG